MKLRLLSILLLASSVGFCQIKDIKSPPEIMLQLGNTSNVYHNTITTANQGTGLLLDTTSNATALYLQTVGYAFLTGQGSGVKFNGVAIPTVNSDTLYPIPLNGQGTLSFFAKVYKVTGTDTIVVTPVQSMDDKQSWVAVPGVTSQTLTPTSLTVPLEADFTINSSGFDITKAARHYGIKFVGNGSSTMAVFGYIRGWQK